MYVLDRKRLESNVIPGFDVDMKHRNLVASFKSMLVALPTYGVIWVVNEKHVEPKMNDE